MSLSRIYANIGVINIPHLHKITLKMVYITQLCSVCNYFVKTWKMAFEVRKAICALLENTTRLY